MRYRTYIYATTFTIASLLMVLFSSAQVAFQRTYGGALINEGRSVKQTLDGGYIIAGSTSSFGNGSSDVLLIKTDSLGNAQFMKTYGGAEIDRGYAVVQLSDSGYAIAGYTNSFGNGGYDGYLIRTDKNGDTLWTKTYGGADWDFVYSCQALGDSGFVMAGNSYSFGNGNSCAWMIRLDSAGNTVWQKTFTTSADASFNAVTLGHNGLAAAGYENAGDKNLLVACVGFMGDSLWYKTIDNGKDEQANAIHLIHDTCYIIGGSTGDSLQRNSWLVKTDTVGNVLWSKEVVTNEGQNELYDFVETPEDTLVLAATNTRSGAGAVDVLQVFATRAGDFERGPTHGGAGNDICYSISRTSDHGFIMAGETNSWGPGLKAVLLIKTDSLGAAPTTTIIGVNEIRSKSSFTVYPNPCKDFIWIRSPYDEFTVDVHDVLGKNSYRLPARHTGGVARVEMNGMAAGLYIVEIRHADGMERIKLIIEK